MYTRLVSAFLRRLYRARHPITGHSYLVEAINDSEHTLRKIATLTFASSSVTKESSFLTPPSINMDDFMLTVPVVPSDLTVSLHFLKHYFFENDEIPTRNEKFSLS